MSYKIHEPSNSISLKNWQMTCELWQLIYMFDIDSYFLTSDDKTSIEYIQFKNSCIVFKELIYFIITKK